MPEPSQWPIYPLSPPVSDKERPRIPQTVFYVQRKQSLALSLFSASAHNPILLAVSFGKQPELGPTCHQNSHTPLAPTVCLHSKFARTIAALGCFCTPRSLDTKKYKTARGPSSPLSTLQKHHHVHSQANPQLPSTPLFFFFPKASHLFPANINLFDRARSQPATESHQLSTAFFATLQPSILAVIACLILDVNTKKAKKISPATRLRAVAWTAPNIPPMV